MCVCAANGYKVTAKTERQNGTPANVEACLLVHYLPLLCSTQQSIH